MPGQDTCRNRVSTNPGNHPVASVRQSASAIGGPPGSIPAARAGAVYLRSVLRSTPKLAASSFCDRPAYQWIKISTISIMSKVLLVNVCSHLAARQQGRSLWSYEGQTRDRHARAPHEELRDRRVGNYVIANPSNLGNFVIADTPWGFGAVVGCVLQRRCPGCGQAPGGG